MEKHVIAITYVLSAGFIATLTMYYLMFRILGLIEDTSVVQIGGLLTFLSPVLGPILGSLIFFKATKFPDLKLWKYTMTYSLLLALVFEIYLLYFEPLWTGLGILVGGVSGIVLSFIAYRKTKTT